MKPKVIAIIGPTASGKSSLGIEIARQVNGEIISVDSRQIYRGMDIGTGKEPGQWDQEKNCLMIEGITHWGIDLVDPDEDFSVADFQAYAKQKIEEIIKRGYVPILVGGTGLWLKALIDGYSLTQTAQDSSLRADLEKLSLEDLFARYQKFDPEGAEQIDRKNKRRLIRALEVVLLTGESFFLQQTRSEPPYDVLQIGIEVDREVLYERIHHRVDQMKEQGLVEEVKQLRDHFGCEIPSMSGIGYRQLCRYFEGAQTLEESMEEIKKDSRQYAKRQMTWWKKDERIVWIKGREEATKLIKKFIYQ